MDDDDADDDDDDDYIQRNFSQKNFPIKIPMLANLQLICDG